MQIKIERQYKKLNNNVGTVDYIDLQLCLDSEPMRQSIDDSLVIVLDRIDHT
jgi:hypothetical protein